MARISQSPYMFAAPQAEHAADNMFLAEHADNVRLVLPDQNEALHAQSPAAWEVAPVSDHARPDVISRSPAETVANDHAALELSSEAMMDGTITPESSMLDGFQFGGIEGFGDVPVLAEYEAANSEGGEHAPPEAMPETGDLQEASEISEIAANEVEATGEGFEDVSGHIEYPETEGQGASETGHVGESGDQIQESELSPSTGEEYLDLPMVYIQEIPQQLEDDPEESSFLDNFF